MGGFILINLIGQFSEAAKVAKELDAINALNAPLMNKPKKKRRVLKFN